MLLPDAAPPGKSRQWSLNRLRGRTGNGLAVIAAPAARQKDDRSLCDPFLEHVFLVLVVGELDPGVVLGVEEEVRIGCLAGGREELPVDVLEGLVKRCARRASDDGSRSR